MKVHTDISTFKDTPNPVITIGTFDGVHHGHRSIIERVKEIATEVNGESALLTFHPHPRQVLFEEIGLDLISTMDDKVALLEEAGLDHLIIHPFTKEFSRISAVSYVRDLLVNSLDVHTVVVGYDHHFGRNREGDIEGLIEYSELYEFNIEEITAQTIDDVEVSSTKIRAAIRAGDFKTANGYLGYPFSLSGVVVKGQGLGHTIGFPTANIAVDDPSKILPGRGVYAVRVLVKNKTLSGMLNIGIRPTVALDSEEVHVEVNIFGIDEDLYSESISVQFIDRIREEQRFESVEALRMQLENDSRAAKNILEAV